MDWNDPTTLEAWSKEMQERARQKAKAEQSSPPKRDPARVVVPFRPGVRASLPRFDRTTIEEARLLAAIEPPVASRQLVLPLHDNEIIDSCPSWLLQMYRRAETIQRIRGPMPLSFAVMLGALVTMAIDDRTGQEVITEHPLDQIIAWGYPTGWNQRARDWLKLHYAFEQLPSYRVPIGQHLFWLVLGEGLPAIYHRGATVWLRKRVPASAAYGIRIDWRKLLSYRSSAVMTRAYLSSHALMDRSAHKGHPLTRLIHEPELRADGQPRRHKSGQIVRSERVVPNPLADRAAFLPAWDVARFLGMANTKKNRHDARRALDRLHREGVVEVVEQHSGYRFYGILPEKSVEST